MARGGRCQGRQALDGVGLGGGTRKGVPVRGVGRKDPALERGGPEAVLGPQRQRKVAAGIKEAGRRICDNQLPDRMRQAASFPGGRAASASPGRFGAATKKGFRDLVAEQSPAKSLCVSQKAAKSMWGESLQR